MISISVTQEFPAWEKIVFNLELGGIKHIGLIKESKDKSIAYNFLEYALRKKTSSKKE